MGKRPKTYKQVIFKQDLGNNLKLLDKHTYCQINLTRESQWEFDSKPVGWPC